MNGTVKIVKKFMIYIKSRDVGMLKKAGLLQETFTCTYYFLVFRI